MEENYIKFVELLTDILIEKYCIFFESGIITIGDRHIITLTFDINSKKYTIKKEIDFCIAITDIISELSNCIEDYIIEAYTK